MRITKDELLAKVREHGGDNPDEFVIGLLEDITDSMDVTVDNSAELNQLRASYDTLNTAHAELTASYDALKKSYADRFTVKDVEHSANEPEPDPETESEDTETFDSIFD